MTAKEFLNQVRELNKQINNKLQLLDSYKDRAYSLSSGGNDNCFGGRKIEPPFVVFAGKIDELEREIDGLTDDLIAKKQEINKTLEKLEDEQEQIVLRYFYIQCLNIPKIMQAMGYSRRWVDMKKHFGVKNIEKILTK